MRFLSQLRHAYKLTHVTYPRKITNNNASASVDLGHLHTRLYGSKVSGNSKFFKTRTIGKTFKHHLDKYKYGSISKHRSARSSSNITPVAVISNDDQFQNQKIALIPIRLFKGKQNDEEAFRSALAVLSLLKANSEQIDLFAEKCLNLETLDKGYGEEAKTIMKWDKDQGKIVKKINGKYSYKLMKKKSDKQDIVDKFMTATTMWNKTKSVSDHDGVYKTSPEFILSTKSSPPSTKPEQSSHVVNAVNNIVEMPISGMHLDFEMDMTDIKDAIKHIDKSAAETKKQSDSKISLYTKVHVESKKTQTIPLHFNALINGTIDVNPKNLTESNIQRLNNADYNEYVTSIAAGLCGTALQKTFPSNINPKLCTSNLQFTQRPLNESKESETTVEKSPHKLDKKTVEEGILQKLLQSYDKVMKELNMKPISTKDISSEKEVDGSKAVGEPLGEEIVMRVLRNYLHLNQKPKTASNECPNQAVLSTKSEGQSMLPGLAERELFQSELSVAQIEEEPTPRKGFNFLDCGTYRSAMQEAERRRKNTYSQIPFKICPPMISSPKSGNKSISSTSLPKSMNKSTDPCSKSFKKRPKAKCNCNNSAPRKSKCSPSESASSIPCPKNKYEVAKKCSQLKNKCPKMESKPKRSISMSNEKACIRAAKIKCELKGACSQQILPKTAKKIPSPKIKKCSSTLQLLNASKPKCKASTSSKSCPPPKITRKQIFRKMNSPTCEPKIISKNPGIERKCAAPSMNPKKSASNQCVHKPKGGKIASMCAAKKIPPVAKCPKKSTSDTKLTLKSSNCKIGTSTKSKGLGSKPDPKGTKKSFSTSRVNQSCKKDDDCGCGGGNKRKGPLSKCGRVNPCEKLNIKVEKPTKPPKYKIRDSLCKSSDMDPCKKKSGPSKCGSEPPSCPSPCGSSKNSDPCKKSFSTSKSLSSKCGSSKGKDPCKKSSSKCGSSKGKDPCKKSSSKCGSSKGKDPCKKSSSTSKCGQSKSKCGPSKSKCGSSQKKDPCKKSSSKCGSSKGKDPCKKSSSSSKCGSSQSKCKKKCGKLKIPKKSQSCECGAKKSESACGAKPKQKSCSTKKPSKPKCPSSSGKKCFHTLAINTPFHIKLKTSSCCLLVRQFADHHSEDDGCGAPTCPKKKGPGWLPDDPHSNEYRKGTCRKFSWKDTRRRKKRKAKPKNCYADETGEFCPDTSCYRLWKKKNKKAKKRKPKALSISKEENKIWNAIVPYTMKSIVTYNPPLLKPTSSGSAIFKRFYSAIAVRNKEAAIEAPFKVTIKDKPLSSLGDNDVLVCIDSVALSDSDLHMFETGGKRYPGISLGNEAAGFIAEVGKKVGHLKTGDHVVLETGIPCCNCELCKKGHYNLCSRMVFQGCLARACILPAPFCYKINKDVPLEHGALAYQLAMACNACCKADIQPDSNVLIMGSCAMTVCTAMCAQCMGAANIFVLSSLNDTKDIIDEHITKKVEFFDCSMTEIDVVKCVLTKMGMAPDIVIDCASCTKTMNVGLMAIKPAGTYIVSGFLSECVCMNILDTLMKEVRIVPSFRSRNMLPVAISLLECGRVPIDCVLASCCQWKDMKFAFETALKEGNNGPRKVIVRCQTPDEKTK